MRDEREYVMLENKKLRLLVLLLSFIGILGSAWAQDAPIAEGLLYDVINGRSIRITRYTGNAATVSIPASIGGLPVTAIGEGAFRYNYYLTSINIPASVTAIGDEAFQLCYNLASVNIPASVTAIGDKAFSSCVNLAYINVDELNTAYTSVDGVLFNKNRQLLICYPAGKVGGAYTIPSSVIGIGYSAFFGCDKLTSITIPTSVIFIMPSAFSGCDKLTSITIPSSVTEIWPSAFAFCDSLINIYVDLYNTEFMSVSGVLFDKSGRSLIRYPSGRSGAYSVPSSVTVIVETAFSASENLTSVILPSSVTAIGDMAFALCDKLASVIIPSSVRTIGDRAFFLCPSLKSVTLSQRTMVAGSAFDNAVQIQYRD
jgi:hypothetical protein